MGALLTALQTVHVRIGNKGLLEMVLARFYCNIAIGLALDEATACASLPSRRSGTRRVFKLYFNATARDTTRP